MHPFIFPLLYKIDPSRKSRLIDWALNTKLKHVLDNKSDFVRHTRLLADTSYTYICNISINVHWLMIHASWHHPTCVSDISFFFFSFFFLANFRGISQMRKLVSVALSRNFHFILEIAYTPNRCESEWVVAGSFAANFLIVNCIRYFCS